MPRGWKAAHSADLVIDIYGNKMYILAHKRYRSNPADPFTWATRKEFLDLCFIKRVTVDSAGDKCRCLPHI
ncbi:MAG: hypothetical protein LC808_22875 [Actinobacteria bacterium]|nr:hypothetical protein [Actinomycetota bacterium]